MTETTPHRQRSSFPVPNRDCSSDCAGFDCRTTVYAADSDDNLAEIVVTANRREQNLMDVPYNISAVTGPALQAAGVSNLTDIARLLPGINIPDLGHEPTAATAISLSAD